MTQPAVRRRVLTVSELAARLRETFEADYATVWVAGEISSLRRPSSGHAYFVLKDDHCQLAAACFQRTLRLLPFAPRDGLEVVARVRVDLYAERGTLQLYVDFMEPLGLGAMRLAFEQLRERLGAEGLFADERKRALPSCPRVVGVVTALPGAAVHDVRRVLRDRWPQACMLIRPVRVQGAGAADDIAAGIAELAAVADVEVLIVGRGGGSLEDLWAFNTEVVARAIVASRVPVISAVGHEVDVTIADLAADRRAATPTAAAALAVPDRRAHAAAVAAARARLGRLLAQRLVAVRARVAGLARALGSPRRRVQERALHLDALGMRAERAVRGRLAWQRREVDRLLERLVAAHPAARAARDAKQVGVLEARLARAMHRRVERVRLRFRGTMSTLHALSPLGSLARGYAIVRTQNGGVVRDAAALGSGDLVSLVLARGRARARIVDTEEPG
jgi:exodeoxyribonuclease VII large subunit